MTKSDFIFNCSIDNILCPEECFTYSTAASVRVGRNWTVAGETQDYPQVAAKPMP